MNERIKELLEQCTDQQMVKPWPLIDAEKFAGLVIAECAKVQNNRSCGRHGYDKYNDSSAIKGHFGIDTSFSNQGGVDWDYLDSQEQPK